MVATLIGAGDIAVCGSLQAERSAALLDTVPGIVVTFGDNAYPNGTYDEFMQCYDPTWGRHKARTRPSPGNHDYNTPGATGYFKYFGDLAGPPGLGYYSYFAGEWQVFALNSSAPADTASAQYQWLRRELTSRTVRCRLAYWHYPVKNSGFDGNMTQMLAIWRLLYDNGATLVLTGHAHNYERFSRLGRNVEVDSANGMRQFVVGTGGSTYTTFVARQPGSEVFKDSVVGVLKLTLRPGAYDWRFDSPAGWKFSDAGSDTCR